MNHLQPIKPTPILPEKKSSNLETKQFPILTYFTPQTCQAKLNRFKEECELFLTLVKMQDATTPKSEAALRKARKKIAIFKIRI